MPAMNLIFLYAPKISKNFKCRHRLMKLGLNFLVYTTFIYNPWNFMGLNFLVYNTFI